MKRYSVANNHIFLCQKQGSNIHLFLIGGTHRDTQNNANCLVAIKLESIACFTMIFSTHIVID